MKNGRNILLAATSIYALFLSAYVHAGYDIGTAPGPFEKLGTWFQDYVDFMDGPFGIMVVVLSIVIGLAVWNFAPKNEGLLGQSLKGVVSGVVLLNVGTWMASFV